MQRTIRLLGATILLLIPMHLLAVQSCPEVSSITRVPGEYGWESTDGRWEGYFASPRIGRGDSNSVRSFLQARWIQLTDLLNSTGVVECDYQGNFGNEIIRFISTDGTATTKPSQQAWSCDFNPDIPGTQCICAGEPSQCRL